MTTLDEISACPIANHAFWSAEARQSLAFMRYAKQYGTWQDVRLERRAFRKNMAHRRARTWFDA
ncbi:MAG: hypothetical protein JKY26_06515 [Pseudomonas sp.]|nr:hypothetical protein [Pseudomonas sp.]